MFVLCTGNVAVGQVVVQQNEVGFGPVHRQFIVVVEGHIGQEQRPRNAVNGLSPLRSGEPTVHSYPADSIMALMVAMFST